MKWLANWKTGKAFLISSIFIAGCSHTSSKLHPDFDSIARKITIIAVLPSEEEIFLVTLYGDREYLDPNKAPFFSITNKIEERFTTMLEMRNFVVLRKSLNGTMATRTDKSTVPTKNSCVRVFDDDVAENRSAVKQLDTIQSRDHAVARDQIVDAYLYSCYQRWCETTTRKISSEMLLLTFQSLAAANGGSYMIGSYNHCGTNLEVALFDGVTNEILWATRVTNRGEISPEQLAEKISAKLPLMKQLRHSQP